MQEQKEIMGSNQYVPTEITNYKKSNFLISGKFKASLLENKIMAISLARSGQFDFGESDDSPVYSRIKVAELRLLVGGNKGSFYKTLSSTAEAMTGKTIGMSSPDSRTFDYVAVITRSYCKDGVFTIEYNHAIRKYLVEITKNFTRLNLPIMLRFKHDYSFRIYELLKSKCYRNKYELASPQDPYYVNIDLNELRLELGVVNPESEKVKKILRGSKKPDYEKAVESAPEKMFERWVDFQRKVLRVAINEINEISDMRVNYQPVKEGRGGKVTYINFTIFLEQPVVSGETPEKSAGRSDSLSEEDLFALIIEISGILGSDFNSRDIHSIAVAADYDVEKIRLAHDLYINAGEISNPTGFIISAIRNGYEKPVKTKKGGRAHSVKEKEVLEEYSKQFIRDRIGYDEILDDEGIDYDDLDAVVNVLYDSLNTKKSTLRVMSEDKPSDVVRSELLKLDANDIRYVIDKLNSAGESGSTINDFDSYIRTLLYRAKDQKHLSLKNLGHLHGDF